LFAVFSLLVLFLFLEDCCGDEEEASAGVTELEDIII
jgi:hypothetical protein